MAQKPQKSKKDEDDCFPCFQFRPIIEPPESPPPEKGFQTNLSITSSPTDSIRVASCTSNEETSSITQQKHENHEGKHGWLPFRSSKHKHTEMEHSHGKETEQQTSPSQTSTRAMHHKDTSPDSKHTAHWYSRRKDGTTNKNPQEDTNQGVFTEKTPFLAFTDNQTNRKILRTSGQVSSSTSQDTTNQAITARQDTPKAPETLGPETITGQGLLEHEKTSTLTGQIHTCDENTKTTSLGTTNQAIAPGKDKPKDSGALFAEKGTTQDIPQYADQSSATGTIPTREESTKTTPYGTLNQAILAGKDVTKGSELLFTGGGTTQALSQYKHQSASTEKVQARDDSTKTTRDYAATVDLPEIETREQAMGTNQDLHEYDDQSTCTGRTRTRDESTKTTEDRSATVDLPETRDESVGSAKIEFPETNEQALGTDIVGFPETREQALGSTMITPETSERAVGPGPGRIAARSKAKSKQGSLRS